jgi:phenylacetate-CoA ligase
MKGRFESKAKDGRELNLLHLEGLKWTVNHAYRGSQFYRNKLDEKGVKQTLSCML